MPRGDERSFLEFEAASVNSVLCTSYTGSARRRRGVAIHKEPHHEALELGRVDLPPEVARLGDVVPDVGRVVDECALHASGLETWLMRRLAVRVTGLTLGQKRRQVPEVRVAGRGRR